MFPSIILFCFFFSFLVCDGLLQVLSGEDCAGGWRCGVSWVGLGRNGKGQYSSSGRDGAFGGRDNAIARVGHAMEESDGDVFSMMAVILYSSGNLNNIKFMSRPRRLHYRTAPSKNALIPIIVEYRYHTVISVQLNINSPLPLNPPPPGALPWLRGPTLFRALYRRRKCSKVPHQTPLRPQKI